MILAAILLGVCQIVSVLGACVLLRRFFNAKQADLEQRAEQALRDWVDPPKPGEPSKLARLVDAMGEVIGAAAARSLKATLNQQLSSVAQVANGAADELQGKANPLLGLLAGGKRGKGAALERLMALLPQLIGSSGKNGEASSKGSEPPAPLSL